MGRHAETSRTDSGEKGGTPPADAAARPPADAREPGSICVRRLREDDSIAELTSLLHRAYRAQIEMGLAPLAGRQTQDVTRRRVASGECYVAVLRDPTPPHPHRDCGGAGTPPDRLVGTILFEEKEDADIPAWFKRPEVAHYSLFGVDPDCQGRGIGLLLLDAVEARARELGFAHLALSMAEPDAGLMRFYLRRGYVFVEHWQWPYTNYRSCILSKPLAGGQSP